MKAGYTEHSRHGGVQRIYKFANGYGASVIRHRYSLGFDDGLWELAVLDKNRRICRTTLIASIVEGWFTEEAVDDLLALIEQLPAQGD